MSDMNRRDALKRIFAGLGAGAVAVAVVTAATAKAAPLADAHGKGHGPHGGKGACSRCDCQGFEGNGNICGKCHHFFADHQ